MTDQERIEKLEKKVAELTSNGEHVYRVLVQVQEICRSLAEEVISLKRQNMRHMPLGGRGIFE